MDLPAPGVRIPFEGIGKFAGQRFTAEWHKDYRWGYTYLRLRSEKGRTLKSPILSMERIEDYFRNLERSP